jgi:hypothetical protein
LVAPTYIYLIVFRGAGVAFRAICNLEAQRKNGIYLVTRITMQIKRRWLLVMRVVTLRKDLTKVYNFAERLVKKKNKEEGKREWREAMVVAEKEVAH